MIIVLFKYYSFYWKKSRYTQREQNLIWCNFCLYIVRNYELGLVWIFRNIVLVLELELFYEEATRGFCFVLNLISPVYFASVFLSSEFFIRLFNVSLRWAIETLRHTYRRQKMVRVWILWSNEMCQASTLRNKKKSFINQ